MAVLKPRPLTLSPYPLPSPSPSPRTSLNRPRRRLDPELGRSIKVEWDLGVEVSLAVNGGLQHCLDAAHARVAKQIVVAGGGSVWVGCGLGVGWVWVQCGLGVGWAWVGCGLGVRWSPSGRECDTVVETPHSSAAASPHVHRLLVKQPLRWRHERHLVRRHKVSRDLHFREGLRALVHRGERA